MKGIKNCKRCNKKILPEDKAVMLMTFTGEKSLEKVYWHWQCYIDWINESIKNKSVKQMQEAMGPTLQKLKPMLAQLKQMSGGVEYG